MSPSEGDLDPDATDGPPARAAGKASTPAPGVPPPGLDQHLTPERIASYRVIRVLSTHPHGVAYLCDDHDLERRVVVETFELDGAAAGRFIDAARAMARCKHPRIATVYDLVLDRGRPCVVREHVGASLATWPGRSGPASRRHDLLAHVARALAFAHRHGLTHGALTEDAIELARDGTPRVVGLGVVGALAAAAGARVDDAAARRADIVAMTALVDAVPPLSPPSSADELAATLTRFARGERDLAAPPVARAQAARPRARRIAAAITALVALSAAVVVIAPSLREPERRVAAAPPDRDGPARVVALRSELERLDTAGDRAAADRLLEDFVAEEDDATTAAEGWLLRGDRTRAHSGPHARPAADAYALSFALAPDADQQRRALAGLAAVHHARWEWDAFAAAIDAYARSPGAATAEGDALTEARHLLFRDHGRASASPARAIAALAPQLLVGQRLPITVARRLDIDGDGRHELLGHTGDTVRLLRAGDLEELARASLAAHQTVECAGHDRFGVFLYVANRSPGAAPNAQLLSFPTGDAIALTERAHRGCLTEDLDGDGADELYLVTGDQSLEQVRRVRRDRATSRRWYIGSTVGVATASDLDGDGRRELIFSAGEWRAYDVRVARLDAAGELVVVDRVRLGVVIGLGTMGRGPDGLTRVAAFNIDRYPSAVRMPPHAPSGLPPGMSTLTFDGKRLQLERHTPIALPPESFPTGRLIAADFDGDGLADLAQSVSSDGSTLLLLGRPGGGYEARSIRDLVLVEALDDGAPGTAVIAGVGASREGWLLGRGGAPLPPVTSAPRRSRNEAPLATLGDPALRAAWERAERLAHIGQEAAAAEALRRVAALASGPTLRGRALARATVLLRRGGHRAGDALERLAASPERSFARNLDAAAGAVADDLEHGALGDAVERAARLERVPNLAGPALRARLAQLPLPSADTIVAFDGTALHPAWHLERPLALDVVPGRGRLTVETVRPGTVATLGIDARGSGLFATVEGELTRMEWASELSLELGTRGAPGPRLAVRIGARGGGRRYQRVVYCADVDIPLPAVTQPLEDADEVVRFRIELAIAPATGRARCAVTIGDRHDAYEATLQPTGVAAWHLRLGASGGQMTLMRAQLARIVVRGGAVAADPSPAPAAHDVVHHRYPRAAERLRDGDDGADRWTASLLRMLVAHEVGAPATARALFAATLGGPAATRPSLEQLAELVRLRDGVLLTALTDVLQADALPVIEHAMTTVAFHDLDEPRVRAEIFRAVAAVPPSALTLAPDVATMYGEALLDDGRLREARRVLERSLAAASVGEEASRGAFLLARAAAAVGDAAEARRWALRSLALAPRPELAADLVLLDHGLAPLARTPGWEPVRALGRTLAVVPQP